MISTDTKPARFTITCLEPGCSNYIHYGPEDEEVPLYCWKHRSVAGRHAAVRVLKAPEPAKPAKADKVKRVILRCTNRKCGCRDEVPEEDWKKNADGYTCVLCGRKMLYHKDVEGKT